MKRKNETILRYYTTFAGLSRYKNSLFRRRSVAKRVLGRKGILRPLSTGCASDLRPICDRLATVDLRLSPIKSAQNDFAATRSQTVANSNVRPGQGGRSGRNPLRGCDRDRAPTAAPW